MKREKIYCIVLALIMAMVLWVLTINFIPTSGTVVIFLIYFLYSFVIFISALGIKQDRKSEMNWVGLFGGVGFLMVIITFMIGIFGK